MYNFHYKALPYHRIIELVAVEDLWNAMSVDNLDRNKNAKFISCILR